MATTHPLLHVAGWRAAGRTINSRLRRAVDRAGAFREDSSGQIAIIFGVALTATLLAVGGGVDLARAYQAKQKLSQVATLACQYASRPTVIQAIAASNSGTAAANAATYKTNVGNYITTALTAQQFVGTQTNSNPFTFTVGGAADVALASSVPTTLMQLARVTQIPIAANAHCYDDSSSVPQRVPDESSSGGSDSLLVNEGFEVAPCSGTCWGTYNANGTNTEPTSPRNTFTNTVAYTGKKGNTWYVMGYCVEIDAKDVIRSDVPEGFHSAELDCGNGSYSAGNSSISTKIYMAAGNYELRYRFASRVLYNDYDPAYICGSTASDVTWANSTSSAGGPVANALRTNQINVYLDLGPAAAPPTHTTIDGSQTLAGSNLIDVCIHSKSWVERSVRIYVNTPGYYWLSFAADGLNESFGGQIDDIRLCPKTCPGSVQDNFPTAWLPSGGVNKVLFEDNFENPVYSTDPYATTAHAKGGNLANSKGATVSTGCYTNSGYSSYDSPPGWPCLTYTGWATAPYNETWFWMQGATKGSQYFSLQGWNGFSNSSDPLNRAVSRPYLLDPGYYNVSYYYTSLMDFGYDFIYGTYCTTGPTNSYNQVYGARSSYNSTIYGRKNGRVYGNSTVYSQYMSTNIMSVYMSNGQLISTPSINSTLGGAPTYTNPDGTTSSTPTYPPDGGSVFTAFNPARNPVIDTCHYSGGYAWVARSVNVMITKPGYYWLTFSSQGTPVTNNGAGAAIDDVKLTALGSLYMDSPPSSPVTIPVADPQPGSTTNFTGFYIIADPLTVPAPLQ